MNKQKRVLGVIGGSGLYQIDGLEARETVAAATPWGKPSAPVLSGELAGVDIRFLARHGDGHRLAPGDVNYRANIHALKSLGVTDIISFSACGSLREALAPASFVIIDQYIDRTTRREKSFFGEGFVAHVSMAHPVCSSLAQSLHSACEACEIPVHSGAAYICIDGPQFSSLAESRLYRQWGADIIGMTNMPEAKLAREAEIPYASVGMVTDYDCWRENESHVEVADILEVMATNTQNARRLLNDVVRRLGPERSLSPLRIETTLDHAVITSPEARDREMVEKLSVIAGRYLKQSSA